MAIKPVTIAMPHITNSITSTIYFHLKALFNFPFKSDFVTAFSHFQCMQVCMVKNKAQAVPTMAWKAKLLSSHLTNDKIKKIVISISTMILMVFIYIILKILSPKKTWGFSNIF